MSGYLFKIEKFTNPAISEGGVLESRVSPHIYLFVTHHHSINMPHIYISSFENSVPLYLSLTAESTLETDRAAEHRAQRKLNFILFLCCPSLIQPLLDKTRYFPIKKVHTTVQHWV